MFRSRDHHQGDVLFLAKITLLIFLKLKLSDMFRSRDHHQGDVLSLAKITLLIFLILKLLKSLRHVLITRSSSGRCAVPC